MLFDGVHACVRMAQSRETAKCERLMASIIMPYASDVLLSGHKFGKKNHF